MPVTSPPRRVLFIDDDPGVRKTLASLLRKAGHDVAEAESGQAGPMDPPIRGSVYPW